MGARWCRTCTAGFLLLLQAIWLAPETPGAGVVYRFRPGSPELSSSHVSTNVEIGPFLVQRELAARGPGGWGMQAPYSAEFDGVSSTMRSDGIGPTNQPLGPKLTVEAWFRASSTDGRISLLTNRAPAGDGFTLGLADGVPLFELWDGGRVFTVSAVDAILDGDDHWLAATVLYDGSGSLTLTLYVDGRHAVESQEVTIFTSPYVLNAPYYLGTIAEGNPLSPTLTPAYAGHIYAAAVRDYIARTSYLSSGAPFDGGEYFGLPAYHDYPLGTFHLPMDQRIANEPVEVVKRLFIPYANDEFIPQGTATRIESSSEGDTELVYVSYYHRTREGTIESERSIVAEINAATGHVRRTFRLRGELEYSHAGGVAFARDALFISSVGFLERYPVPPYGGSQEPKYIDLYPDPSGSISVQSKSSFVSHFEDTLWVGDWRPANDVAPFLYSHPLKADGRPETTPADIFALPRNVQGVDLFRHNGQTYVFLSRNRNSREAEILRYRIEQLDRNSVAAADTAVTMPYGIEDLSIMPDGTLWTNSESGTVFYQRKDDPWTVFYPFVYSIPARAIIPGATSIGTVAFPELPGFEIESYPNPLTDSAHITISVPQSLFARVHVLDLLGRDVAVLKDGRVSSGITSLLWDAGAVAPGIYFAVLETTLGRWTQPMMVVR